MRGSLSGTARKWVIAETSSLIRPCGATFPLGEEARDYLTGVPINRLRLQWQWAIAMPRA